MGEVKETEKRTRQEAGDGSEKPEGKGAGLPHHLTGTRRARIVERKRKRGMRENEKRRMTGGQKVEVFGHPRETEGRL
ncbi:MAG: hypothetical protein ABSC19_08920 [Syntrophorhabdales bacterium]|jgi:hypothetical protein